MTTIHRKLPLVIEHGNRRYDFRTGRAGALVWRSDRPALATFCTERWPFDVTLEGLYAGLLGEWVEPSGTATIRPIVHGLRRWLSVEVTGTGVSLIASGDPAAGFLAEAAFAAEFSADRVQPGEWQHEWPTRPLHHGGAA